MHVVTVYLSQLSHEQNFIYSFLFHWQYFVVPTEHAKQIKYMIDGRL